LVKNCQKFSRLFYFGFRFVKRPRLKGATRPSEPSRLPGGNSEREPPDPISNSEVKTLSADGSVGSPHVRVGHRQALNAKSRSPKGLRLFLLVRPAGRTHLEVQVLYRPDKGNG